MTFVRPRSLVALALAMAALVAPDRAHAQAADPKPVTPALDFSGVILGNYRYTYDDATKNANGGLATNKFDVERIYLNFRMPAGEDGSIRVTTDLFNNSISGASCVGCYAGWNLRLKYGYFQYNYLHDIGGQKGFNAIARIGMVHTAVIDHEEQFWPRWISMTSIERFGFFSSSDVGIATVVTLPKKMGEVYATIANGSGYATVENDPYKDYSARVSWTPFGNETNMLKTFTISPWYYTGHAASKFLTTAGSAGTAITDGLTKRRDGIFIGLRDRRLSVGLDWAQKVDGVDVGASIPTWSTYDNTTTLTAGWLIFRPFELFSGDDKTRSRLSVMARLDNVKPFTSATSAGVQTTSATNKLTILGLLWDLNSRASFSVDFQNLQPTNGSATVETKTLFAHWNIIF